MNKTVSSDGNESGHHWHQAVYDELYRLSSKMLSAEYVGNSLQPTLIVNDAYLLLLKQGNVNLGDRCQVLAAGSMIIRRMLVDHARKRRAIKRGGKQGRGISLDKEIPDSRQAFDAFDVADTLDVLAKQNPRAARVVELKFFGGLDGQEIAEMLDVSPRTVSSDWRFAKAWLCRRLGPEEPN